MNVPVSDKLADVMSTVEIFLSNKFWSFLFFRSQTQEQ